MSTHGTNETEARPASVPQRVASALIRLGGALATLLILMVFAIVVFAIVRRYLIDSPLLWGDEFIGYMLVAIVMLGAAEALRRGDHIAIDLLANHAGRRGRLALEILGSAAVIVFAGLLGWSAWKSIAFARAFGSYSVGYIEIETWIPQVPMLAGAFLLIVAAAARLFTLVAEHRGR
ncbi:MAG: TRAP transporter permease DctQ [Phyllobacteriaceae bacterium]|nr:TRAP transporter permease DctQ [Phyllobacteriaceae bacterium]MBA89568.1 TRAP transporter permease DctQ [Phyllobacteriaceae bacterium]